MRILVAEDERITRVSLVRQLQNWGHSVTAAEDGQGAWDASRAAEFDIIITDWEMPRLSGVELVQRLRETPSQNYVYIMMLTGRSDKADLVSGIEAGADDFISKPFDREELRVRLLAGERIVQLERRLALQNVELQSSNERMRNDLKAAARVQQELLPAAIPKLPGLKFAWRYRPCDELGGDLLNVVPIAENVAAMYLADVSGHGVAASLVSVSVHRSLSVRGERSSLILTHDAKTGADFVTSPDQVAKRLNAIYPMATIGGHFLTLAYATIDASTLKLNYCAAGHPGPMLSRHAEAAVSMETGGVPIGIMDDAEYEPAVLQLIAGDRVYIYSDGLMEASNADGRMFGRPGIEAAITEARSVSLEASIDALIAAASKWQNSDAFTDDISVVALEVTGK